MPGYTGLDCKVECPYPSFGTDCQGYCSCSIELCDVARGCSSLTTKQIVTTVGFGSLTTGTAIYFVLKIAYNHIIMLLLHVHVFQYTGYIINTLTDDIESISFVELNKSNIFILFHKWH